MAGTIVVTPYYVLDFRSRPVGGPVVPPTLYDSHGCRLGEDVLRALGDGARLVFLVHGFNNSRPVGLKSCGQFAALMRTALNPADAVSLGRIVIVLWPGDDRFSPLSYSLEERDADATADQLSTTIHERIARCHAPSFVAHSLGSRVVLETMRRLHARRVAADQVVLMAAAVDADALARSERYGRAVAAARRVATVASTHDRVLHLAFPAGDFLASVLFGGYTRVALGRSGPVPVGEPTNQPVPPSVLPLAVSQHRVGHGDYLPGAGVPGPKPRSAAAYAAQVIAGRAEPDYPAPTGL